MSMASDRNLTAAELTRKLAIETLAKIGLP